MEPKNYMGKKKEPIYKGAKKKIGEFEDDCLRQEKWMKNKRVFYFIFKKLNKLNIGILCGL